MQATSPPARIEQYEIKATLAASSTWRVYKAYDLRSRREVVLKVIAKRVLSSFGADFPDRFRSEANAATSLDHPGIVRVFEYGEDTELAFLAMDYVQGWHLRERFRVPTNDAVRLVAQLLEALDYAHQKRILHGAVNPSNLLLSGDGKLRIANFGVVRLGSGMPGYLAPEQVRNTNVDCRCDIFSCGVILYELLTGASPFAGPSQSLAQRVCVQNEKPPSEVNPSVSPVFDRICGRALAKNPDQRYSGAGIFRDEVLRANRDAAHDLPLSPAVSHDTIIAHATFKSQPDSGGTASSSAAAALSAVPSGPVPRSIPVSAPAAGERSREGLEPAPKPQPSARPRVQASAQKSIANDSARVDELVGNSPRNLAAYCQDAPRQPEEVIHIFAATIQALIATQPVNVDSATLAPQNIVLDLIGTAKMPPNQNTVGAGAAVGIARYAAPETISEKTSAPDPNSAAAHVYALGMIFYEILLGRKLFEKTFPNQRSDLSWLRWQSDLESKAAPLKSLLPECPEALSDLIESMMEKNVDKRQADLNVIVSQLRDMARRANKTIVLRKPTPSGAAGHSPGSRSRSKKLHARVVAFLILAVVCGATAYAVWRDPDLCRRALLLASNLLERLRHFARAITQRW